MKKLNHLLDWLKSYKPHESKPIIKATLKEFNISENIPKDNHLEFIKELYNKYDLENTDFDKALINYNTRLLNFHKLVYNYLWSTNLVRFCDFFDRVVIVKNLKFPYLSNLEKKPRLLLLESLIRYFETHKEKLLEYKNKVLLDELMSEYENTNGRY